MKIMKKLVKRGVVALATLVAIACTPVGAKAEDVSIKKGHSVLENSLESVYTPKFNQINNYNKMSVRNNYNDVTIGRDYGVRNSESSKLKDILQFGAGLAVEYGVHELGHYVGAKAVGADIEFKGGGLWSFKGNYSDSQKLVTGLSGFALPMAVSETLLRSKKVKKDNPFVMGLISAPFLHNLAYVIKDVARIGNSENDFKLMDDAGLSRSITYPLTLIPSAWQAYRLWKNPKAKNKIDFWVNVGKGFSAGITKRF